MNQDERARLTAEAGVTTTADLFALIDVWEKNAVAANRRVKEVEAECDRLRDALRRARLDATDVGASGWDSTRLERTKEAVARIDAALAESEETT